MTQRWEVHHGTTWAADSAKAVIRGRLGEEHARGKLSACYKLWQCRADCSVIVTDQTEVVPKNFSNFSTTVTRRSLDGPRESWGRDMAVFGTSHCSEEAFEARVSWGHVFSLWAKLQSKFFSVSAALTLFISFHIFSYLSICTVSFSLCISTFRCIETSPGLRPNPQT